MIDPARLRDTKRAVPPVHIERIVADHAEIALVPATSLPAGTRDIEIDYSAPSFSAPLRTHFRYKLEGHDDAWQSVATRRQAFYSDLGPGHYRFSVAASNGGDDWSAAPASVDMEIAYAFYETLWFKLLCAALLLALAALAYRSRIERATALAQSRLAGTMQERERIARELHDTLLQSIQGIILRVDGAKNRISPHDATRAELDGALEHARAALIEGHDRVHGMRSDATRRADLAQSLCALCRELSSTFGVPCSVAVEGESRSLDQAVADETYWIAREALINACRHSKATRIDVRLRHGPHTFEVSVADDGIGIAADADTRSDTTASRECTSAQRVSAPR